MRLSVNPPERDVKTLQKFASIHAAVHNHFNLERHLNRREILKQNRAAAMADWRQLAARDPHNFDIRRPVRIRLTAPHEVLNPEWFTTTKQAQIVINQWLRKYNHIRPHQALNMLPPVPETVITNGTELWARHPALTAPNYLQESPAIDRGYRESVTRKEDHVHRLSGELGR